MNQQSDRSTERLHEFEDYGVLFVPPLHEQRRAWILDILRREAVSSVLDVGCGEGALLECLCHPAPWLPHDPTSTNTRPIPEKFDFTHVRTLHGLDISAEDLEAAIEVTTPPSAEGWAQQTRWEQLEVKIWEGGLEIPNAAFEGVECVVAMEVIEHLPPSVIPFFAPTLLGIYQPRLLLMTTPSYDFNPLFCPPAAIAPWGFPDPTQCTSRVFRHDDHKFEWTVAECTEWCNTVAEEWGYDVVVGGVGRGVVKDPWGRDEEGLCATQVACFRRRKGVEWDERRKKRAGKMALESGRAHEMRVTHLAEAHAKAGKPASGEDIRAKVQAMMEGWGDAEVTVNELWREVAISGSCGGWLEVLIDAIEQDETFKLRRENRNVEDWKVELVGARPKQQHTWKNVQEEQEEALYANYAQQSPSEFSDEETEMTRVGSPEADHDYDEPKEDSWVGGGWGVTDVMAQQVDTPFVETTGGWGGGEGWATATTWDDTS